VIGHVCAVPGCDQTIDASLALCARHWAQVPKTLRSQLCRIRHSGCVGRPTRYRRAVAAAVAAVRTAR